MLKSDFYYELPEELIAQVPLNPRDSARLMQLDKSKKTINHLIFTQLTDILMPGDMLVLNNSKVIPARLIGQKQPNGAVCELLLLKEQKKDVWECLAKPGKRLQNGSKISFGDASLEAEILETLENGSKIVKFFYDTATLYEKLEAFGSMPLPPYIKSRQSKNSDYQTVYAKNPGSSAAPTAGLHFTSELIETLKNKGILFEELVLHVGLGTFRPVKSDNIEEHQMHSEWYSVSEKTAQAINDAKSNGGRIISVGTTSCRVLETLYAKHGKICASGGNTDIFLYPGKKLNVIDGLITNFHLPESTLIMLVSAFYGHAETMSAYKKAVEEKYRFFSFGDAMIII